MTAAKESKGWGSCREPSPGTMERAKAFHDAFDHAPSLYRVIDFPSPPTLEERNEALHKSLLREIGRAHALRQQLRLLGQVPCI